MTDDTSGKIEGKKPTTLTDSDIVTTCKVGRRSLLGIIGGAVAAAVALATGIRPDTARAAGAGSGYTDNDQGPNADGPNQGRGPRRSGPTGVSDADQGPNADQPNYGRGPRSGGGGGGGYTDADQGPNADGPGRGRGPRRAQPSGVSDADQGPNADQPNYGRGRANR